MRRASIVWIVLVGIAVGIAVTLVAILVPWLPAQASVQRERIDFTFWFVTAICIAIFALVAAVILYSVVKFRVRPDDDSDGPSIHGHTGLEIVWTAVPAILVTAISVVSAVVLYRNDNPGDDPLRVNVTAQQFAWSFEYPDANNLRSNTLALPLGRPVRLTLESNDVIHSFFVREFGQKSDALPGSQTHLVITPTQLDRFAIMCTELCGLGHATMRSEVQVMRPAAFESWLREQRQPRSPGGEDGGAAIFSEQGCGSCHAFEPAGTDAEVGPSLDDLAAAARRANQPEDEYIRQSIVAPDEVIAPGYQPGVMPQNYEERLSGEQLNALVQYLAGAGGEDEDG